MHTYNVHVLYVKLTWSSDFEWAIGTSKAMSRRKRNTSAAEKMNESSSSLSPGCCHVLNSASKDWKPGLERIISSSRDGWMDLESRAKQPRRRRGAVKLSNRIWKGERE